MMACVYFQSVHTGKRIHCPWPDVIRPQIVNCEKKSFAASERFNFDNELKKSNVNMLIVVDDCEISSIRSFPLVGYLILSFPKASSSVMLHKICITKSWRRRGIADAMIRGEIERLKTRGCHRVSLWVRQNNIPAMALYKHLGFKQISKVEDYYGEGLAGLHMILELQTV